MLVIHSGTSGHMQRRRHKFEGGGGGVNALKGGGSIQYKTANLKKVGVHDPPPSSYGGAASHVSLCV